MEIKDVLKEARMAISDRISSPIIPAFVISWTLWNYKFVMIVLSNNPVSTTIRLINEIAFPCWISVVTYGMLLPVATAGTYIFAFPFLEKFVVKFWSEKQKEIKNEKLSAESEILLTPEEGMALRRAIREIVSQHQVELSEKGVEIGALQKELSRVTAEMSKSTRREASDLPVITEEELSVLRLFAVTTTSILEQHIFSQIEMLPVRVQHVLDSLLGKNCLSFGNGLKGKYFELTSVGRSVLVVNKVV